ncbi:MAG: tRNA pseudouridine(55) synthase TruB [Spirochaetes bacterium]|nr:tRNA pseudouridine(55) synthase TruB [Spirochaetota bacterium]
MDEHTSGIINFYKPTGLTCAEFVDSVIKKNFPFKKIGYSGTLDKFAEGVLPILVNQATKIAKFLEAEDKEYIARIKLGVETDTLDITGQVVREDKDFRIDMAILLPVLQKFIGVIFQLPPEYSAIKIKGQRASDLVRSGEKVELKPRKIRIYNIELLSQKLEENIIELKVSCSKGTYIRALARDMAKKLGTGATVISLIRSKSGLFERKNSIKREQIKTGKLDITDIKIFTINEVLARYSPLIIKSQYRHFIINGKRLNRFMFVDYGDDLREGIYRVMDHEQSLLAMVEYKKEKFFYLRVFHK